ncbi:MAG TPA: hypothetical protein VGM85_03565 [Paraburkholderia sp.]
MFNLAQRPGAILDADLCAKFDVMRRQWDDALSAIAAASAQATGHGTLKLVPVEPTPEMILHNSDCQHHAWDDKNCPMRAGRFKVWRNMLAAAPALTQAADSERRDASKMVADLEAEQTYIASCRETCGEHEVPRWDRLQAVIDHLKKAGGL